MSIDWKNIGLAALDVVTGVGSTVAGVYAGPAAAGGIQMAGGAIKGLVNNATEEEPPLSRKEALDRADFQRKAPTQLPAAPDAAPSARAKLSESDEAVARAELTKLGYSPVTIEAILAGPRDVVASNDAKPASAPAAPAAAPAPAPAAVEGNVTKSVDWEKLASIAGQAVKGYMGTSTGGFDGTTQGALPAVKGTRTT